MIHRIKVICEDWPLVFDVNLDENQSAKFDLPMGGWWGKPRSNGVWPLILTPDQRLDFGANPEDDEGGRYSTFDVFPKKLLHGEEVKWTYLGETYSGTVAEVIALT